MIASLCVYLLRRVCVWSCSLSESKERCYSTPSKLQKKQAPYRLRRKILVYHTVLVGLFIHLQRCALICPIFIHQKARKGVILLQAASRKNKHQTDYCVRLNNPTVFNSFCASRVHSCAFLWLILFSVRDRRKVSFCYKHLPGRTNIKLSIV